MEELRYGARLSETSVGPCSSGLWQRLTQCSPAWWSCVGSGCVLLPLYYRLQQVDEELGHRRQDVGDEAGREGRGDEAGEQDLFTAALLTAVLLTVPGTRPASRTYSQLHYSQLYYSDTVGTRPASRTRPTQRAQSARWAASLHSAMWSNGLWSRIIVGSARTLSTPSHSALGRAAREGRRGSAAARRRATRARAARCRAGRACV